MCIRDRPTVADLAEAPEEQILKLWEGLGYYNRARNLQRGAQAVMAEHGGVIPASFELLKKLPGIGDYTAGAISSIAFQIKVPAVDGNVLRVISRVLWRTDNIDVYKRQGYGSGSSSGQGKGPGSKSAGTQRYFEGRHEHRSRNMFR